MMQNLYTFVSNIPLAELLQVCNNNILNWPMSGSSNPFFMLRYSKTIDKKSSLRTRAKHVSINHLTWSASHTVDIDIGMHVLRGQPVTRAYQVRLLNDSIRVLEYVICWLAASAIDYSYAPFINSARLHLLFVVLILNRNDSKCTRRRRNSAAHESSVFVVFLVASS